MATRITRKKAEKEAELPKQEVPVQLKSEKKPAGKIPDGFLERARERSKRNLEALKDSGVFKTSEFEALKAMMTDCYKMVGKTSAPVINVTPEALLSFLKDGSFKTFGESGSTKGDPEAEKRLDFTSRTYGYKDLKDCEKYGTIPVEEVSKDCPIHGIPLEKRFTARYGSVLLKLKAEVGERTTMNLLDSSMQWGLNGEWQKNCFGWLFPVPYRTDKPEDFVGCLMAPPTNGELKEIVGGPYSEDFRKGVRNKNYKLLALLSGKEGHDYIEAHVHGDIVPEDVAEIVFVPGCVKDFPEWKEVEKAAARYNIAVKAFTFIGIDE